MTAFSRRAAALALALLFILCLAPAALADGKQMILDGNRAAAAGKFKAAIDLYSKAIRTGKLSRENLAVAYNNRGSAKEDLGQHKAALMDVTKAIRSNPDYAEAYYNRSFIYEKMGKLKEALADARKAAALQPRDSTYLQREYYLATKQK